MAWDRFDLRLPEELAQRIDAKVGSLGLSRSEYHRLALVALTFWLEALDAVDAGHTTAELRDPETIARLLGE